MTDPVGSDLARAAAARLAHVERGRGFRLRPSGAPGAERERSFRFDRVEGAEVLVRDERAGSSLRFPLEEVARRGELGGHAAVGCAVAGGLLPALACGVVGQKFGAMMAGTVGSGGGVDFEWFLLGGVSGALLGAVVGRLITRWEPVVPASEVARLTGGAEDVPEQFRG